MNGKRLSALFFLILILLVPAAMILSGGIKNLPPFDILELADGTYAAKAEEGMKQGFPLREELSNLAWNLRYRTGTKEIDGYFITPTGIIKNVEEPNTELVQRNNAVIRGFAQRESLPVYFMLLPTAAAIKQQELPDFATATLVNQKAFVEEVYRSFGGDLRTVSLYPVLFANREQYLYYHTEDAITPLGGYYIYAALGEKLGASPHLLDKFSIEYAVHSYNGSLSQKFPYATVQPDILALYHYRNQKFSRTYQIKHSTGTTLGSLYDKAAAESENPMNIYFGGLSPVTDIQIRSKSGDSLFSTKLLIFGDDTAKSYVPFLTPHYAEIKIVNTATVTPQLLKQLDYENYDQVLFAFSADTYMHNENLALLGLL